MTAQIHERLIYEGERTSMAFCPPIPQGHPRIAVLDEEEARRSTENIVIFSSACWRGYIGTWAIQRDRFYLVAVEGKYHLKGSEPLLADWFTGTLRIPRGDVLDYVHAGFATVFEKEIHVRIQAGRVIGWRVIENGGNQQPSDDWADIPGIDDRLS
jgi:hypothetical protein